MIRPLLPRWGRLCKFASSSLLSFALDYCLFLLFSAAVRSWAWGLLLSNVAARLLSACFNYMLNKYMVSHGEVGPLRTCLSTCCWQPGSWLQTASCSTP